MKLSVCTVDYSIERQDTIIDRYRHPLLHLFCRDSNFNRIEVLVDWFIPYFYMQNKDYKIIQDKYYYVKEAQRGYRDLSGNRLTRVYTFTPPQVGSLKKLLRDINVKSYEADILFPLRFLIDLLIYTGIEYSIYTKEIMGPIDAPSRFKKLIIDIEVDYENEEDIDNFRGEIIVYGIYDEYTDEYHILSTKKINKKILEKILIEKGKKINLYHLKSEEELLIKLINLFDIIQPDVIITFSPWDMKYTIGRMRALKLNPRRLSPMNIARIFGDGAKISGLQILDIGEMYRTTLRKQKFETLEFIAKKELNLDAFYHNENVPDMWREDYKKVFKRNLRDVELVKILNEELQLFTYFDTIRRTVGCNLSDTIYRSRVADILDLRNAKEENVVLPSRRYYQHIDYEGAKVFKCKTGKYTNVLVVDWSAMYPSIVRVLNIGYTTFIPGKFEGTFFEIENLQGMFQTSTVPSFVIKAFDKLEPLRKPHKKLAKQYPSDSKEHKYHKAVADGLKSLINAEYGKFGFSGNWKERKPAARLYEPRIAAAITYVGRMIQEATYEYLEKLGYTVVYGDTDSLFIHINNPNEIDKIISMLNKFVENLLKEKLKTSSSLELEKDKLFTTLALLTKKRYGGKREDGTYEWKGLELVKRDQAVVTQEVQEILLKKILNGATSYEVERTFLDYCDNFNSKTIQDIAMPLRLTQKPEDYKTPSYHLKAFLYSRDILHIPLEVGKRFYLAYIKDIPEQYPTMFSVTTREGTRQHKVDAIAFNKVEEIPEGFTVDYEIMKEKTVINKSEDILSLIDINIDKLEKEVKGYVPLTKFV